MLAIFKRDLAGLFQTVTGWLYVAATLALFGLYFYAINLSYGDPKLSSTLSSISFITFITVPVLTMRSLSEEMRSKTDQLLLTSPVSVGKIVVAKYLATAVVHTATVVVMGVGPLIILSSGGASVAQNYVSLLGFWMYGLCCLAIGVFVSALTESQVIAAVLTFVFIFVGFMMGNITGLIQDTGTVGTFVKAVMGSYDLLTPMQTFFDGCISLSGVVYYLTVGALFVFLTSQVVQKRRWTVSAKRLSLSAFSAGFVGIAVALTVFVNLAVGQIPSTVSQIDVTASQLYSMTDTTKDFLAKLDKDVTVYVIGTESSSNIDATVKQTLQKYADSSSHVKVVYEDPYANPTFASKYTTDQVNYGTLIVVCGDVSKVLDYNSLFESEVDYQTYQSNVTGYDGEGQLTSAIQYVTSDNLPVVYELEGHSETALAGDFTSVVSKANVTLNKLTLLSSDAVPDDAQAVIINGPQADLSSDDAKKLTDYVAKGGNLFVSLDYQAKSDLPNLEKVLAEFKVTPVKGLVLENDQSKYYNGNPLYLLPTIDEADPTASITNGYVFAPYSRGLSHPDSDDEITYTPLLTTSDSAVAKADLSNVTTSQYEDGDAKGPFDIGLEAVKTADDDKTSTLAVFGSTLMFTDDADQMVAGSNSALFSGVIASITNSSDVASIVIPAKAYDVSTVTVPAATALLWAIILIGVVPLLCLGAGVVVWYRRRKS
ncbi:MAG: Gldg family protein [Propionibacteriaceae bacterium]|jgi:ABC-2 type transport system permease protein|nr:Gldg family protein [Propionibacteriaceae bacterium]